MNRKLILAMLSLTCATALFSSCDKVKEAVTKPASIDWSGLDVTVTIPIVNDTDNHDAMGTGSFTYDLDSLIKSETNNLLSLKNIDSFKVTSCVLTIENPDADNNFGNFKIAKAAFSTNANSTNVVLGEIDNNPTDYAPSITLPVNTTVNLREYLPTSGTTSITYTLGGKMQKATNKELTINVHMGYRIHVK